MPHKLTFYRDKGSKRNDLVNDQTPEPNDPHLKKYWKKRYFLFSKFDRGVKIDDESWYSVTPEPFAKHIAQRVVDTIGKDANVLDAFSGIGGNAI
jgi:trimethylguanosine synthase